MALCTFDVLWRGFIRVVNLGENVKQLMRELSSFYVLKSI
ncbi:hypothetical protein B712_0330 [Chlamydia psittaci NJ1]|nr:hypothetical protein B712_0330 [Chlamydia psittaci NJ1]